LLTPLKAGTVCSVAGPGIVPGRPTDTVHESDAGLTGRLEPFSKTGMANYRAYTVGADGHFVGYEPMKCADDAEAIEKAKLHGERPGH
jgi:hypothetical protein